MTFRLINQVTVILQRDDCHLIFVLFIADSDINIAAVGLNGELFAAAIDVPSDLIAI